MSVVSSKKKKHLISHLCETECVKADSASDMHVGACSALTAAKVAQDESSARSKGPLSHRGRCLFKTGEWM